MLSEDIETVDKIVKEGFPFTAYSTDSWLRIKTALAELGTTPNTQKPSASQIAAQMDQLASEPCENGTVPIYPSTLRGWARQLRLL